jgi:DNA polymerase-3 subunit beta
VAASDRTNGIKLSFGGDTIRLHTESPDTGESDDEVSCEHEGAAIDVGVNAQYLLDELAAIQGDDVEIGTAGELDPTTLKALGDESGSVIVQMPMRL